MKTFKRHKGIIPPLSRKLHIDSILFFDTETRAVDINDRTQHLDLKLGYGIYIEFDRNLCVAQRQVFPFTEATEFVNYLAEFPRGKGITYVVAHNVQFDIQVLDLPRRLHEHGFTSSLPLISPWSFIWNAEFMEHKYVFFDSMNIFQTSLEQLGRDIGLEKRHYDARAMSDAELSAYCLRDCEILERAFEHYFHFLRDNGLGYFCTTIAWQAMTAYRSKFMDKEIHIHAQYPVLKLERKALHGGRTECFFIGQAPDEMFFLIDVNSMYASVMKRYPLPVEFFYHTLYPSLAELRDFQYHHHVIARVDLDTIQPIFPKVIERKVCFPVGRFQTVLHSPELDFALATHSIRKIHEMAVYRKDWIFDSYVDFFYNGKMTARKNGDKTTETMYKLFTNSLYGKWAQEQTTTEYMGKSWFNRSFSMPCVDTVSGLKWTEFHWFGDRYISVHKGEKPYTSPALAGAITAYARCELFTAIQRAGVENCLYCDTDSIIVNFAGLQRLSGEFSKDDLGAWKMVDMSDNVQIYGLKDYRFGRTVKFSGLKRGSIQVGENTWTVQQFRSFKRALRQGETGKVELTKITKKRDARYSKGVIQRNGRVLPFRLEE